VRIYIRIPVPVSLSPDAICNQQSTLTSDDDDGNGKTCRSFLPCIFVRSHAKQLAPLSVGRTLARTRTSGFLLLNQNFSSFFYQIIEK